MLAAELALARVDVAIVERRASQDLAGSRAGGLHSRTIEVLDQRGVADRFLSQGQVMQVAGFAFNPLDISDFPTRHNYGLALFQNRIEHILAAWVDELAVPIYRGREVTGFAQDDTGVDVELSDGLVCGRSPSARLADGGSLRAKYLVGCDGGRSLIRKKAGIDFPGWDPSVSYLIAEAEMTGEPELGIRRGDKGINGLGKLEDGKRVRVVLRAARQARRRADLGRASRGAHRRLRDRFRCSQRHVALEVHRYDPAGSILPRETGAPGRRRGARAFAGRRTRAQHRCPGRRELGMEAGPSGERHITGEPARYLPSRTAPDRCARAQEHHGANGAQPRRRTDEALRETISELLKMDEPRKRYAAMMSGLDIRYDLGTGHPLLGRRMPDLDLVTESGPRRVFTLLHVARPVLLNLGEPGALDIAPWADRVQRIDARYAGVWELPVLGAVSAPTAVLIRPDGHVAWIGDGTDQGLRDALTTWFGLRTGP